MFYTDQFKASHLLLSKSMLFAVTIHIQIEYIEVQRNQIAGFLIICVFVIAEGSGA